ncbi:chaperonin 10-like protein [Phycomyces nitens]|nr:chaperonin 10-like protein [Phycomyces nitens]
MTLSPNMSVASWQKLGSIDIIQKKLPTIKAGEVLVKVAASGICGTDLHICRGETPHASQKVVIGHEFSGHIAAVHEHSKTNLAIGDLVSIDPNIPCNACSFCRNKKYHLCNDLFCIGVTVDGGMSEYVAVPITAVYSVPSHVTPEVACLAEPLSCVVHAVDMGEIKSGDRVLIIGAGPIGMMALALCSTGGAHVTVIEPNNMRREMAVSIYKANAAVAPGVLTPGDGAKGEGFDVVFECVGRPETMSQAVQFAKAGGIVVWVGVAKTDARVSISPFDVYRKELTIRSTYTNPFGMDRAVKILADEKVDWKSLVTHSFPLQEFDEAWKVFLAGTGLKVCIKP